MSFLNTLLFFFLMAITTGCTAQTATVSTPNDPADSTVHHYVNGKISVIHTPWIDGRRETKFYNLKGDLTYTIEEVRLSYQVSAELEFHENGGVKSALIFTNPGASQFMYHSTIHFSTINEPQWKLDKQTPAVSIEDAAGSKYFWHKKEKRWIKQEVVSCAPVPSKED